MNKTTGGKRGQMEESKGGKDRGSANAKTIGLTDDLKAEIEADPDLEKLLKLNDIIQKVKRKNDENKDKIQKLGVAFGQLGTQINGVFKE